LVQANGLDTNDMWDNLCFNTCLWFGL
jgi:hypothetical protein